MTHPRLSPPLTFPPSPRYDHVIPSRQPEVWNLPSLYLASTILGTVACISSVLLLFLVLDSHRVGGAWQGMGLPPLDVREIKTIIYLKVSLSDFLTLFAARTRGPFWSMAPGKKLVIAAVFAMGLSTVFAATWPFGTEMRALSALNVGLVWVYVLFWWFIQDMVKVVHYSWRERSAAHREAVAVRDALLRQSAEGGLREPLLAATAPEAAAA